MKDEPASHQPGVLRVLKTRKQTRRFYDKISRVYDLLAERAEGPMRDRGLAMLAAAPGERVLEVGAGTGHCLAALARAAGPEGEVHGLDLSPGMLARAGELLEREGLGGRVKLIEGDAAVLPYDDAIMDGVFTSFTLELFDTPEIPVVLGECRRVLRPGGRLVVVAMSRGDGDDPMLRFYEWAHRHFPNFVDCRPIHVRRALEDAGFAIEASVVEHMWVPVEIVRGGKPRDGA